MELDNSCTCLVVVCTCMFVVLNWRCIALWKVVIIDVLTYCSHLCTNFHLSLERGGKERKVAVKNEI